jgi:hypothetical protein
MASEPTPSSTTISASSSPEIHPPPPPPPRSKVHILNRIDRTIHRLTTLLSNPASTDALLGTTSYTLTLLHAILSRLIARRLIGEKAQHAPNSNESAYTSLIARILPSIKELTSTIDDHRIFIRLWGLLGLYTWARALSSTPISANIGTAPTRKERFLRILAWSQIASLVLFQVLENAAYLARKGVLTGPWWADGRREARWWMWSCRGWGMFVALELLRLAIQRYPPSQEKEDGARVLADGEKEGKLLLEAREKARRERQWDWRRDLVSNIGYMPLTVHYSVEGGLLPDWAFGILGVAGAGALLVDTWAKTA